MKEKRYWFPVRPARAGWGWGTPITWQGWVAYAIFLASLLSGMFLLLPYGQLIVIAFSCVMLALFIGLLFWKGEPQSMRDNRSP